MCYVCLSTHRQTDEGFKHKYDGAYTHTHTPTPISPKRIDMKVVGPCRTQVRLCIQVLFKLKAKHSQLFQEYQLLPIMSIFSLEIWSFLYLRTRRWRRDSRERDSFCQFVKTQLYLLIRNKFYTSSASRFYPHICQIRIGTLEIKSSLRSPRLNQLNQTQNIKPNSSKLIQTAESCVKT